MLAFTYPSPLLRILLRCAPVLPVAIWTLWIDPSRPLQTHGPAVRIIGRVGLLLLVMGFTVLVLGIGINWLYDPSRIA